MSDVQVAADTALALRLIEQLEASGCKVDAVLPDGTHRYCSTHCRHGHHGLCAAKRVVGDKEDGSGSAAIARNPAQCKHCGARCVCRDCDHRGA